MTLKLKNKQSKGLTLIEVIVALALIFMVAAFLLTTLSQTFTMLSNTKQVTKDTFAMMEETELGIQAMRKQLKENPSSLEAKEFNLFGVEVEVYPQVQEIGGNRILSYVGKERPVLLTPEIESVNILIQPGDKTSADKTDETYIDSEVVYGDDFYLHMMTSYQWYVSKPGYNTSDESDPDALSAPDFPADYEIINGAKSDRLNSIKDEYIGRFFVLTATPASNYGKLGATAVSNAVQITGLPPMPSVSRLFHFDAGVIDLTGVVNHQVNRWNDLSGNNRFLVQESEEKMSFLSFEVLNPNGPFADIPNQYLFFDGIDDTLQMDLPGNVTTDNISVFIVAKANKNGTLGFIGDGSAENMWELGNDYFKWGAEKLNSPYHVDNQTWHVFGASVGNGTARISIDDRIWEDSAPDTVTLPLQNTQIGRGLSKYSNIGVAEVIAFSGSLTDDEYAQMIAYLRGKYGL